jgi:Icc-related predicted phosphoesterase
MKVVFVSDIHGMGNYAEKIKDIYVKEKFDLLVVLGDLFYCSSSYSSSDDYAPDKVLDILNSFKNNMYIAVSKILCYEKVFTHYYCHHDWQQCHECAG